MDIVFIFINLYIDSSNFFEPSLALILSQIYVYVCVCLIMSVTLIKLLLIYYLIKLISDEKRIKATRY